MSLYYTAVDFTSDLEEGEIPGSPLPCDWNVNDKPVGNKSVRKNRSYGNKTRSSKKKRGILKKSVVRNDFEAHKEFKEKERYVYHSDHDKSVSMFRRLGRNISSSGVSVSVEVNKNIPLDKYDVWRSVVVKRICGNSFCKVPPIEKDPSLLTHRILKKLEELPLKNNCMGIETSDAQITTRLNDRINTIVCGFFDRIERKVCEEDANTTSRACALSSNGEVRISVGTGGTASRTRSPRRKPPETEGQWRGTWPFIDSDVCRVTDGVSTSSNIGKEDDIRRSQPYYMSMESPFKKGNLINSKNSYLLHSPSRHASYSDGNCNKITAANIRTTTSISSNLFTLSSSESHNFPTAASNPAFVIPKTSYESRKRKLPDYSDGKRSGNDSNLSDLWSDSHNMCTSGSKVKVDEMKRKRVRTEPPHESPLCSSIELFDILPRLRSDASTPPQAENDGKNKLAEGLKSTNTTVSNIGLQEDKKSPKTRPAPSDSPIIEYVKLNNGSSWDVSLRNSCAGDAYFNNMRTSSDGLKRENNALSQKMANASFQLEFSLNPNIQSSRESQSDSLAFPTASYCDVFYINNSKNLPLANFPSESVTLDQQVCPLIGMRSSVPSTIDYSGSSQIESIKLPANSEHNANSLSLTHHPSASKTCNNQPNVSEPSEVDAGPGLFHHLAAGSDTSPVVKVSNISSDFGDSMPQIFPPDVGGNPTTQSVANGCKTNWLSNPGDKFVSYPGSSISTNAAILELPKIIEVITISETQTLPDREISNESVKRTAPAASNHNEFVSCTNVDSFLSTHSLLSKIPDVIAIPSESTTLNFQELSKIECQNGTDEIKPGSGNTAIEDEKIKSIGVNSNMHSIITSQSPKDILNLNGQSPEPLSPKQPSVSEVSKIDTFMSQGETTNDIGINSSQFKVQETSLCSSKSGTEKQNAGSNEVKNNQLKMESSNKNTATPMCSTAAQTQIQPDIEMTMVKEAKTQEHTSKKFGSQSKGQAVREPSSDTCAKNQSEPPSISSKSTVITSGITVTKRSDDVLPSSEQSSGSKDVEFVSKDPAENADNFDPVWAALENASTDVERYRKVRERWRNLAIPDPNKDLTFRHHRNLQFIQPSQPVGKRKKPVRSRSCVSVYEERIRQARAEHQTKCRELERKFQNDISYMGFQANFYGHGQWLNDLQAFQNKSMQLSSELSKTISRYENYKSEARIFQNFYQGLGSDEDKTMLTPEQEELLDETERMYSLYAHYYNEPL